MPEAEFEPQTGVGGLLLEHERCRRGMPSKPCIVPASRPVAGSKKPRREKLSVIDVYLHARVAAAHVRIIQLSGGAAGAIRALFRALRSTVRPGDA